MVAKSFQDLRQLGDPFQEAGKMYVFVQTKKGTKRKVRWYTQQEYKKMYPSADDGYPYDRSTLKNTLGFQKGYVTLIECADEGFLERSNARYHCKMGWYIVSTEPVPANIPTPYSLTKLTWEEIENAL